MQKKLIALALAAVVTAPAFAQSNVTIYGRVDYGYMSRNGNDGGYQASNGRKGEMAPGMQAGSRIGFKGEEALGNGLKAIFQIETGVQNDAPGAAGVWSGLNRNAFVGLTGNFGTVVGGRLDGVRYGIFNKYDPFAGGGMGNFTQMTAQVDRADNAVAYISPKWNGFGLVLAYSTDVAGQEVNGVAGGVDANTGDGVLKTIMGTYDNGPLSVSLDYERIDFENMGSDRTYVATAGASYDFKVAKVSALYDVIKNRTAGATAYNKRHWLVGVTVPVGNFLFKANYGDVNDKLLNNADSNKFGLGVNYYLSKRTNVYADYGRIDNDNAAVYSLSPAANAQKVGYGTRGFNIGLAHNF